MRQRESPQTLSGRSPVTSERARIWQWGHGRRSEPSAATRGGTGLGHNVARVLLGREETQAGTAHEDQAAWPRARAHRPARGPESRTKPGRTFPGAAGARTALPAPSFQAASPAPCPRRSSARGRRAGGAAGLFLRKEGGRSGRNVDSFPPPHTSGVSGEGPGGRPGAFCEVSVGGGWQPSAGGGGAVATASGLPASQQTASCRWPRPVSGPLRTAVLGPRAQTSHHLATLEVGVRGPEPVWCGVAHRPTAQEPAARPTLGPHGEATPP